MRRLSQTAVVLALTACMSPSGKMKKSVEGPDAQTSPIPTPAGVPEVSEENGNSADVNSDVSSSDKTAAHTKDETKVSEQPNEAVASADPAAPESDSTAPAESGTTPPAGSVAELPPVEADPLPPIDPECTAYADGQAPPYYLKGQQLILRQLTGLCRTPEGKSGYLAKFRFVAVGVPCASHPGRVERRYEEMSKPELVRFHMNLNCDVTQEAPGSLASTLQSQLNFAHSPRVAAIYPMLIEYWEFVETGDASADAQPAIRSKAGRQRFKKWADRETDSLAVRLYGRESSLVPTSTVYEAQVHFNKRRGGLFQVQVDSIKALNREELSAVLKRCSEQSRKARCGDLVTKK